VTKPAVRVTLFGADFTDLTDFNSIQIFENTALKQGKVNLTWDETDPNRLV
jgi:hypothetical protein